MQETSLTTPVTTPGSRQRAWHPSITEEGFAYALRGAEIQAQRFALKSRLPAGLDADDLRSVAVLAVYHAAELYDPAKGASWTTYAWWWVWGRLRRAVQDWLLTPAYRQREVYRGDVEPEGCDLPALSLKSLVEPMYDRPDPGCDVEGEVVERDLQARAVAALRQLSAPERELLERRYWGEATLEQLAGAAGVSRTAISRRHRRALDKIREQLGETELAGLAELAEVRR